jgi:hypothetical protein
MDFVIGISVWRTKFRSLVEKKITTREIWRDLVVVVLGDGVDRNSGGPC